MEKEGSPGSERVRGQFSAKPGRGAGTRSTEEGSDMYMKALWNPATRGGLHWCKQFLVVNLGFLLGNDTILWKTPQSSTVPFQRSHISSWIGLVTVINKPTAEVIDPCCRFGTGRHWVQSTSNHIEGQMTCTGWLSSVLVPWWTQFLESWRPCCKGCSRFREFCP